jgi:hypothetical protein
MAQLKGSFKPKRRINATRQETGKFQEKIKIWQKEANKKDR